MRKRNLLGQILVCAVMLASASSAWAASPAHTEPTGWLGMMYSQVLQWWSSGESEEAETARSRSQVGGGEVLTTNGGSVCDPGTPDPGTERGCAGDPDG